jgi:hypothetical protein
MMRSLYGWEIAAARQVFGDHLAYSRVCIHEGVTWPDWANKFGRWLKRLPPPDASSHNAITLAHHCFFPVALPTAQPQPGADQDYAVGWLIHELTHVWQFEHLGWAYLFRALAAQFRLGDAAYTLPAMSELVANRAAGWTLLQLNGEAEAVLVAEYYYALRDPAANQERLAAYAPYVADLGQKPSAGLNTVGQNSQ